MPRLTELELTFENDNGSEIEDRDLSHIGEDISQLARLSKGMPALKLVKLQNLMITGQGLRKVFRAVPTVTHLILDSITVDGPSTLFSDENTLPNLQFLELLDFEDDDASIAALNEALKFAQTRSPKRSIGSDAPNNHLAAIQKVAVSVKNTRLRDYYGFTNQWPRIMEEEGMAYSYARK